MGNVLIVAEISANHGKSIEIVKKSIAMAKKIGCDAVKIQTYRPDTITLQCDNEYFKIDTGTIWDGTTLYDLYNDAFLPWEWHRELFEYAKGIGILLFSTPFDSTAVDLLEDCGNPVYKIASFEITDVPLIEYAASKHKPMVISTGIATSEEIREAVDACHRNGNDDITLLKCTSEYPAKIEDANLRTMLDMKEKYQCKIGLSDHTIGTVVATTAAAMGATIIEKHFILDRCIGGPDASFSMEPHDFEKMIAEVRKIEKILGEVTYEIDPTKEKTRKYARSLFVVKDVEVGDVITPDNVRSIRPSDGLSPKLLPHIVGKRFINPVKKGTPLSLEMIEG